MKKRILLITLFGIFLFAAFSTLVSAQSPYQTQTFPMTLDSSGTFSGNSEDVGLIFYIQGIAGATGSVTTQLYNGNPQPTASIPNGVTLAHFISVTVNMNPNEFTQATIYITYTDANVASIQQPYALYKYSADTNSYTPIQATVDTATKTIVVTLNSINDPLFAIGGTATDQNNGGISDIALPILAASVIIIVVIVVFSFWYLKRRSQ